MVRHGTRSRYMSCTAGPGGGKCDDCREANRAYIERWRRGRGVQPIRAWRHGTIYGYRRRCRCEACRAAEAEYRRSRRAA